MSVLHAANAAPRRFKTTSRSIPGASCRPRSEQRPRGWGRPRCRVAHRRSHYKSLQCTHREAPALHDAVGYFAVLHLLHFTCLIATCGEPSSQVPTECHGSNGRQRGVMREGCKKSPPPSFASCCKRSLSHQSTVCSALHPGRFRLRETCKHVQDSVQGLLRRGSHGAEVSWLAARLLGCLSPWLPGCPAARLPSCLVAWLPGCQSASAWSLGWQSARIVGWATFKRPYATCTHSSDGKRWYDMMSQDHD